MEGSRAEVVRGLARRLAELGAEAEGRPGRVLPHVHDMVLPDQLRVLADDILAADPSADLLHRAAAEVERVRGVL